jgi:hypothetical protein
MRIGPLSLPWRGDKTRDDPYWDVFIQRAPAHPNNLVPHALREAAEGGVNPTRSEVHSSNVLAGHIKELGQFFGADLVGIVELESNPFREDSRRGDEDGNGSESEQYFAIVCALKDEFDVRVAQGIGGQTPRLKGLFATCLLGAYIRELGCRATRATRANVERNALAVAAGLGTMTSDGRLLAKRTGQQLYVAEIVYTVVPLEADGREQSHGSKQVMGEREGVGH